MPIERVAPAVDGLRAFEGLDLLPGFRPECSERVREDGLLEAEGSGASLILSEFLIVEPHGHVAAGMARALSVPSPDHPVTVSEVLRVSDLVEVGTLPLLCRRVRGAVTVEACPRC